MTNEIIDNQNNLDLSISTKKSFSETLAIGILYFWGICCVLWLAWWVYIFFEIGWDGGFSILLWLILWVIVRGLCRWVYSILMLWVNNRKRNAKLTKITNNQINPETGQVWLNFDLIPQELYLPYTEIKDSWFRLFESTPNAKARTRYVNSVIRDNKDKEEEATHALFIEHQFPNKQFYIDAFVHIRPDIRENGRSSFISALSWPWIVLYILFKSDDLFQYLANRISSYGINTYLCIGIILCFSGYISYLIHKKAITHNIVKLESRWFEKTFDVDSNDKIIARQVCNPVLVADLQDRLIKNNLNKCSEIYIDFRLNRLIYKFDYSIFDTSWLLSEEYVKSCVTLTNEMIDRISIIRNMAVIYAGRVVLDRIK